MPTHIIKYLSILACGLVLFPTLTQAEQQIVDFEDLPQPPTLSQRTGLEFTENANYADIIWQNITVFGRDYRVDTVTPGPIFGLAHSENYAITNDGSSSSLTTEKVLIGLWVGQNEYYGYGGGADQITISALDSQGNHLSSVSMDLPDNIEGEAEVLQWMDTRQFVSFANIAAYRIDRQEIGTGGGSWVADDLHFMASAPYPDILLNNSNDPLSIHPGDKALVSIKLNLPSQLINTNADWWIVKDGSSGLSYYDFVTNRWISNGNLLPSYQGGLQDISELPLFSLNSLDLGTQHIYFAVDTNMNGTIDIETLYYDVITVIISP
ncbi:MAG: hypothetical protein methR_P2704 [Methyloprofundus sp.]|nr:MAG: hypothetical protein methR_P2704 [Methyloprofundus sp.]